MDKKNNDAAPAGNLQSTPAKPAKDPGIVWIDGIRINLYLVEILGIENGNIIVFRMASGKAVAFTDGKDRCREIQAAGLYDLISFLTGPDWGRLFDWIRSIKHQEHELITSPIFELPKPGM